MDDAYLILENGVVLSGKSFGYDGEIVGELVFSTGMTGYLETLSDPAYYGQIVIQTFPLIGNYGVIREDFGAGPAHLKAYIVRDWCQEPSNFRSEGNLDSFLREKKIPGIYDIDTRKLTREIRDNGTMNAMVSKTPEISDSQWAQLRGYKITGAVAAAAANAKDAPVPTCRCDDKTEVKLNVAVWDFGGALRLTQALAKNEISYTVLDYASTADEVLASNPNGVLLTGGPGDPAENTEIIREVKRLCGKNVPMLAVGLGHQLLALANGAKTEKLPFGHRGANQAVKKVNTARSFVSSQNHGYAVMAETLPENAAMSYVNVNDGTCEGIEYNDIPALSVQFDPTEDILDIFKEMMEGGCPKCR